LVARGYADDGDRLYGRVTWTDGNDITRRTAVTVELTDTFPFAPPKVRLDIDAVGSDAVPSSFHLETDGTLCLFEGDTPVEGAAWRDAERLEQHIVGWITQAAAGWPGDEDCDLERYLTPAGHFVTYDSNEITGITGTVATSRSPVLTHITGRPLPSPRPGSRAQRKDRRNLAWVGDLGDVTQPIRDWSDLATALTKDRRNVEQHIRGGYVDLLVLRYRRGAAVGVLIVQTKVTPTGILVYGCEGADESLDTRTLRAGAPAGLLTKQRIAVVGCGAVGSYIADLLFRAGALKLTLIDPQRLRPGNLIRHVASVDDVGKAKVIGVRNHLARTGLPIPDVRLLVGSIDSLRKAMDLVRDHTLVIDATADSRASSLLAFAADDRGGRLVAVCLQREGGIARVDRWPLTDGETHLPPVPEHVVDGVRERGCGDLVSLTPPHSVSTAANLAVRVLLDQLAQTQLLPATVVEVLRPQADAPYDKLGQVAPAGHSASAA
jgi:hypothetical protein